MGILFYKNLKLYFFMWWWLGDFNLRGGGVSSYDAMRIGFEIVVRNLI